MKENYKGIIGVLTSGGDAPGMNAAIRGVVRSACDAGYKVIGINRGYQGLLDGDIEYLTPRSVADIIDRGGTMLKTARCMEMMTEEGQQRAYDIAKALGISAIVVIGGDGSLTGGLKLSNLGLNIIGIPGTIDLDLPCSEYTIGFDTAVNTCMESVNKIRDTSGSHQRCSIVEVMGRNCGSLALWCAVTGGAEECIIPEKEIPSIDDIVKLIVENRSKGKKHNLIVVAEGVRNKMEFDTFELAKEIQKRTGVETRATMLGHLQRGGSPTSLDCMHASLMGNFAIKLIEDGEKNKIVVVKNGQYAGVDLKEGLDVKAVYDDNLYKVLKSLSV